MKRQKKCYLYTRVSTAMQVDGYSLDARKEYQGKSGTAVDTSEMEERVEALQEQLRQVQGTKTRLEHQMDNLAVTDSYYEQKIADLQRRYDEQYNKTGMIEAQIEEWHSRMLNIQQEKISADNIYQLLLPYVGSWKRDENPSFGIAVNGWGGAIHGIIFKTIVYQKFGGRVWVK